MPTEVVTKSSRPLTSIGCESRLEQSPCDADGVLLVGRVRQDNGKLIAAHAAERVVFSQARFEAARQQRTKQAIAGVVPERVVHELEAIQVDEHQPHIAVVTARD